MTAFSDTEIMALAGYQLDPGHSDLDDVQPMSVRVHDGECDARHLRCTLGDVRQAKRTVRAGLKATTEAPELLEALELIQGYGWSLDDSDAGLEIKRRALAALTKATGQ